MALGCFPENTSKASSLDKSEKKNIFVLLLSNNFFFYSKSSPQQRSLELSQRRYHRQQRYRQVPLLGSIKIKQSFFLKPATFLGFYIFRLSLTFVFKLIWR
jgi:hypothetical protein